VGAFAPDGQTLAVAVGHYPGPTTISLLESKAGRVKVSWPTKYTTVYDLAFFDSGRGVRALLGDAPDVKATVTWDAATGQRTSIRLLTCKTGGCDTAVSADGRLLALAPYYGAPVTIWDIDADRELTKLTNGSTDARLARGLALSGDGRTLFVIREDGSFEIWDVPGQQLKDVLPGHTGGYVSFGIRLAPDGRSLASRGEFIRPSSHLGGIRLAFGRAISGARWHPAPEVIVVDIATGRCLARAAGAIDPFYSPDSATIATYESDRSIRLRPSPDPAR
jgi:WD40 repeat protein